MDIKNAYLHSDLSKEVYMQPPPGLSHHLTVSVIFVMPFIHLNKLLIPGLSGFVMLSLKQALQKAIIDYVLLTHLSTNKIVILLYVWSLQEMMLLLWLLLKNIFGVNLR